MTTNVVPHRHKWEIIAAFAFGCIFLVAIIALALYRPNPTPFEYTVFRITIALAAAGVGAILPGLLHVRFKNFLRATGALALFVVYFFAPAAIPVDVDPGAEPVSDAKVQADLWLSSIDNSRYKDTYSSMASGFKDRYPYAQFEELIGRSRSRLGKVVSRQFVSATPYVSPPGAPKGFYRQYVYRTAFANDARPIYEVVWVAAEGQEWRVSGFNLVVKTINEQFIPYEPG